MEHENLTGNGDGWKAPSESSILTAALAYATERGWHVFPVPPGKKKSYKSATHSAGSKWGMTKEAQQIRADWKRWPKANIGLPTGAVNGIFVLETDTPAGHAVDGEAALRKLEGANEPLPETLTATSPTGSRHYFFRHPGSNFKIKNSASEIGPGIDVRGDGGMVLAVPSLRPGVGLYQWLNDKPIADAPQWLINLATAKKRKAKAHDEGDVDANGEPKAPLPYVAAALAMIPNDDVGWEQWNNVGLATFRATGGSEGGRQIFDAWSGRSSKYEQKESIADTWRRYQKYPPDRIGAGTLVWLARQAYPKWEDQALDDLHSEAARRVRAFWRAAGISDIAEPAPKKEADRRAAPADRPRSYELVRASAVIPRAKNWLWKGHLLRGAQELLTGTPGLGKSQVQCSWIACATTGRKWPDSSANKGPVNVIMITAEDTVDQEVIPRLIAAGANCERVNILKKIKRDKKERMFLLSEDIEILGQVIDDVGDVGLVTLDPITAYMGKIDSHHVTDVRGQLGPLTDLAERKQVAFATVTHPPKASSQRAIDHYIGSQAFIAAARIGHLCIGEVDADGQQTGRILLTNPKNNPHEKMPTLAYRIEQITVGEDQETHASIVAPFVVWEDKPLRITADQAIAAASSTGRRDEAKQFLEEVLANGPMKVKDIEEQAAARNLSKDQLKRAKAKLYIDVRKDGLGGWIWEKRPDVM